MRSHTGLTPVLFKDHMEGPRPQSRSNTYRAERGLSLGVGQSGVLGPRCDRERGRISSRASGVRPHLFRLTSTDNQLSSVFRPSQTRRHVKPNTGSGLAYLHPLELGSKPRNRSLLSFDPPRRFWRGGAPCPQPPSCFPDLGNGD